MVLGLVLGLVVLVEIDPPCRDGISLKRQMRIMAIRARWKVKERVEFVVKEVPTYYVTPVTRVNGING